MGNRALTVFWDGENDFSSVCYNHYNGGRNFYYLKQAKLRSGDEDYSAARFVAELCKRLPGNLSVGIWGDLPKRIQNAIKKLPDRKSIKKISDWAWEDNGLYIINISANPITVHQVSKYFENRVTRKDFFTLDPPRFEYLDKPECRLIGTVPARPDDSGFPPKRIPKQEVVSSMIRSIAVSQKHNLIVEFNNGAVYRYYNVNESRVRHLLEAESKGKYFNKWIKGDHMFKIVKKAPQKERRV